MFERFLKIKQKPEPEQAKPENEVKLEEVAELEKPTKVIIEKIKDRIENGEYGLIIGDDASARIPTRILGDFIREISRIRGQHQPNIIFIPGKLKYGESESTEQEKFEEHISKFGMVPDKKILIITDTVFSGESLQKLVHLIKKAGHIPEIATIGQEFNGPFGHPEKMAKENLEGVEIISGEFEGTREWQEEVGWAHTPKIYDRKYMSGVSKKPGDFKSHRLVDEAGTTDLGHQLIQFDIERSRKEAKIMTNKLINWYTHLNNEK